MSVEKDYICLVCKFKWTELSELMDIITCPQCRGANVLNQTPVKQIYDKKFEEDIGSIFGIGRHRKEIREKQEVVNIKVPTAESTDEQIAVFKEIMADQISGFLADLTNAVGVLPKGEKREAAKDHIEAIAVLVCDILQEDWIVKLKKNLIYN